MAAMSVLNAFQRGKLPWFVAPPNLKAGRGALSWATAWARVRARACVRGRIAKETVMMTTTMMTPGIKSWKRVFMCLVASKRTALFFLPLRCVFICI